MGAVPKHRISKSRRGKRRTHHALKPKALVECSQCRAKKLPYQVCGACGYYRGVQVLAV